LNRPTQIDRVVLVILDGLRPDAVETFALTNIAGLAAHGAATWSAQTVAPSLTASVVASLMTGIAPTSHGVVSERFHIPRRRGPIDPLPRVLNTAGYPCSAFVRAMPVIYTGLARRIARHLGVGQLRCAGSGAEGVLDEAESTLGEQRRGLIFMHWPDADLAGHERGWMSSAYAAGAQRLDAALGHLTEMLARQGDQHTLMIALADHGGGGVVANDHDSEHPDDRTVPVILAGASVHAGMSLDFTSLLDIPATILWALGVRRPSSYSGRPLVEAFRTRMEEGVEEAVA
jgi:arylsulfatase A-like enzyme